jgi:protein SCO1/2
MPPPDLVPTAVVGGDFDLVDHDGRRVTLADYAGRHVLLFFGFTHCRVVCPRTLSRISAALDLLGEQACAIQPLYISVDPARDTPAVMKAFLADRFPRFTGLTGEAEHVEAVKRTYRVHARRAADADDPSGYAMPHTALVYLLDTAGHYLTHFADSIEAPELATRLRQLPVP